MVKKYVVTARPVTEPISEPVTKLGGQPVWLDEPCWPLSRSLGEPMRFIGQFALYPELFGTHEARMAYLFMTEGDTYVDGTWEADGGENAVILQPGAWNGPAAPLSEGPTLFETIVDDTLTRIGETPQEFAVDLAPGDDPDTLDENEVAESRDADHFFSYVDETKVGGTPAFLQFPEYPDEVVWRLVAQINSRIVPSGPNFGDAGVGYVFLSGDGRTAKFLWQCS